MANDYEPQDRRLQSKVSELEQKIQSMTVIDAQHTIELATLKAEMSTLKSTTATSVEVKAAGDLLNVKLDHLHEGMSTLATSISAIRNILLWAGGIIIAGVIGALLKQVLVQ